jgi:hypothetical protein
MQGEETLKRDERQLKMRCREAQKEAEAKVLVDIFHGHKG